MTGKRFIVIDDYTIVDIEEEKLISTDGIVDKMNELHEENIMLKNIKKDKIIKRDYTSMGLYDNKTEKENEELKQLLDYADDLIQSHLSEHYIQQWRNFKTGHKGYNDFWEEKLKKHKELKEDVE